MTVVWKSKAEIKKIYGVPTCHTCGKPYDVPYRVYDAHGKVILGCVDDCHTGNLVTTSESNRWHNRPEAKRIREASRKHLDSLLK